MREKQSEDDPAKEPEKGPANVLEKLTSKNHLRLLASLYFLTSLSLFIDLCR